MQQFELESTGMTPVAGATVTSIGRISVEIGAPGQDSIAPAAMLIEVSTAKFATTVR